MRQTEIISRADFDHPIDIRSRDELGERARAFHKMVGDLKNYTCEVARVAAEKEGLAGELRLARQLQQEMLPHTLPPLPEAPHVCMYAEMEPAKEVVGITTISSWSMTPMGVVVADVSGKGIPAGLFMMSIRAVLRGTAPGHLSPADTLPRINQLISHENLSAMFVTTFYFVCHMEFGRIVYCNAVQPPLEKDSDGHITCGRRQRNGERPPQ
jgi:sigma-B regulation protein RsbU (phosphoserine phosphatase)